MAKIDLFQVHKADYAASLKPALIRIAKAGYLSIAGHGAPGGTAFQQATEALYNVAFAAKMASKLAGRDYAVCKLEGLWWEDLGRSTEAEPKEKWSWQLLIRIPDFIGKRDIEDARKRSPKKVKGR
jgi:hypothetical protein